MRREDSWGQKTQGEPAPNRKYFSTNLHQLSPGAHEKDWKWGWRLEKIFLQGEGLEKDRVIFEETVRKPGQIILTYRTEDTADLIRL